MNPRTDLHVIIDTARRALDNWQRFEETHADLGASALPGTTGAGVTGGDIVDPVYASALHLEDWNETCLEIHEALGHMRAVERRMNTTTSEHPETARLIDAAIRAARCKDPVCTDNAVKDGYCFQHWQDERGVAS